MIAELTRWPKLVAWTALCVVLLLVCTPALPEAGTQSLSDLARARGWSAAFDPLARALEIPGDWSVSEVEEKSAWKRCTIRTSNGSEIEVDSASGRILRFKRNAPGWERHAPGREISSDEAAIKAETVLEAMGIKNQLASGGITGPRKFDPATGSLFLTYDEVVAGGSHGGTVMLVLSVSTGSIWSFSDSRIGAAAASAPAVSEAQARANVVAYVAALKAERNWPAAPQMGKAGRLRKAPLASNSPPVIFCEPCTAETCWWFTFWGPAQGHAGIVYVDSGTGKVFRCELH